MRLTKTQIGDLEGKVEFDEGFDWKNANWEFDKSYGVASFPNNDTFIIGFRCGKNWLTIDIADISQVQFASILNEMSDIPKGEAVFTGRRDYDTRSE